MAKQGLCFGCLCSRDAGVKLIPIWISIAFFINYQDMIKSGPDAYVYWCPIIFIISAMIVIGFTVLCIPAFNTESGRYLTYWWWFYLVTLTWNIYSWYLIFNNDDKGNVPEWDCDAKGV